MYTGITRGVFPVVAVDERDGVTHFSVELDDVLSRHVELGASVAIDGVCCTVVSQAGRRLSFDAIQETRSLTTLGDLKVGRGVSVERSCKVGDELGGHDVFGRLHYRRNFADGCSVTTVTEITREEPAAPTYA